MPLIPPAPMGTRGFTQKVGGGEVKGVGLEWGRVHEAGWGGEIVERDAARLE